MSMNEGLEIRVPFLDKNLVEFSTSLPDYFKQQNFENKWILKKSMEGILPNDIIYRKKTGFGLPLRSWLKDDLKDWLRELLSKKNIQKRGLFNYNSINNLIEDNEKNKIDATYTLFSLACQEIWFQKFIDNSSKF